MKKEHYRFEIWEDKSDGYYLANITMKDGHEVMTQGKNRGNIFEMVADCIMCYEEIECSKWNRFWHLLLKLN